MQINKGTLLISEPFLQDPYFQRTAILICEHDEEGTLGFVINKIFKNNKGKEFSINGSEKFVAYYGGPVAPESLHFIHTRPDIIENSVHVAEDIYWSGNYEQAMQAVEEDRLLPTELKFFIGYSGWDPRQLQEEINENTWLLQQAASSLVLHKNANEIWKRAIEKMGKDYKIMSNFPVDPRLN